MAAECRLCSRGLFASKHRIDGFVQNGILNQLLLAAVIDFLGAREVDLLACAEALDVTPAALVAAGATLAQGDI